MRASSPSAAQHRRPLRSGPHPFGHPPTGAVPEWITFTPDGKTVYVSNSAARSVSAIDTKTLKSIAVIPAGEVPKRINTLVLR